jgi:hypothetical protein
MKRLGGVAMIKLPCDFFEVLYCDEGIYFFCSAYCRDNWASDAALLSESENPQQSIA